MHVTIAKAARRYSLSRSTLLYYDKIGLLRLSIRSEAGYRLYDQADMERLEKIMVFREIGMPLADIPDLLDSGEVALTSILLKRLHQMNNDIQSIRAQQEIILKLLRSSQLYLDRDKIDISAWLCILQDAGITQDSMQAWHAGFEKSAPVQHEQFLSLLGLTEGEIKQLRDSMKGEQEK